LLVAEKLINQAIQLNPKEAESYTLLGLALHRQKKLDKAITGYRQAIQLSSNDAEAYNRLGNALQDLQKLDEAIAAYGKAIELEARKDQLGSLNPFLHIALGNAFQQLGGRVYLLEALSQYRRAFQIGGTGALAQDKIRLSRTCGGKPHFWQLGMGNREWGIPYTAGVSLD
jgi:superkiller protein 3